MADLYISPVGSGTRDGSSAANAGTLADLAAFVSAAGPGGTVYMLADQGAYRIGSNPVSITDGGTEGQPVTIRGIDSAGNAMRAEIIGTRTVPYDSDGNVGEEVFRLLSGADHLSFKDMSFKDIGYGAFRVGADIVDLSIEGMDATNVQFFFENYVSGANTTATITGLTIRDVQIDGFSRGAVRLRYDTHDVLIEDMVADSQRQDFDDFAIGIHMDDTAHDIVLRRVTMRNSHDTISDDYWNGDGFASERGNYDIRFEDTVASGSTDAGYDIKSASTVLVRAVAFDNARNFRLWGYDTVLEDIVSLDPNLRGGSSNQGHIWLGKGAIVSIDGAHLSDSDARTTVFNLAEEGAKLTVAGLTLSKNVDALLFRRHPTSSINVGSTDYGTDATSGGEDADYLIAGAAGDVIAGNGGADTLRGAEGADSLAGGAGADLLIGAAGDDALTGGADGDVIIGGDGFDIASYAESAAAVSVDLGGAAAGGDASGDLIEGVEALIGSSHHDTLGGDANANVLDGGAGDDRLDGEGGDDLLVGGAGADTLIGGEGVDMADYSASGSGVAVDLSGDIGIGGDAAGDTLVGIEILRGSAFDDGLTGSDRDDLLIGGAGADMLVGGGGIDTADYRSSAAAIAIDLATGINAGGDAAGDTLTEIEIVIGSGFADAIVGDAGDNRLFGDGGDDRLAGGAGDDVLVGGGGADALAGGAGFDMVDYSANTVGVVVDLAAGVADGGDATGDTLTGVEAIAGTDFSDLITGSAADETLLGGGGTDVLEGAGGADLIDGGTGVDTVSYASSGGGVEVDLFIGEGLAGDATGDVLRNVENVRGSEFDDLILGSAAANVLAGGAGDDAIDGGAGDDRLIGGLGADLLVGGDGFDVADYSASAQGIVLDLGNDVARGGDAEGDVVRGIEGVIGSVFADTLIGDDGDTVFFGSGGADAIDGAGGDDTVDYSLSAAAVAVDLAGNAGGGRGGDAEGDTLAGIERLVGSAFADTLSGDEGDNVIAGGAGADTLVGGGGFDTADYRSSSAAVVVNLATGAAAGGDAAGDVLSGFAALRGSALNDTLTGDAAANLIEGGAGNDIIDGGAGGDTMVGGTGGDAYTVDSVDDVIVELAGEGEDAVRTTLSAYTLGETIEKLTFIGTGAFTGTGNALANTFTGTAAAESYFGLDGDDKMLGSAGADSFDGGEGRDLADYSKSKSAITINLTTNVNLRGDAAGDTLTNVETISATNYNDHLTGSAGDDVLYARGGNDTIHGLDGNDLLDGDTGNDTMYGGAGDDAYIVTSLLDRVIEEQDEGTDTIRTNLASYTLGDHVENLAHTSVRPFFGTGNALDNVITGGSVGDVLTGLDGDDTLIGRGGADTLIGGEGSDTASYASSAVGVRVDLSSGVAVGGDAHADSFDSIENVTGSAHRDTLTGDAGGNVLAGLAGRDMLVGGSGDDLLLGGEDDDRLDGGEGADVAAYNGALADYRFAVDADGAITVADQRDEEPDGEDIVRAVELFRFADGDVSYQAILDVIASYNSAPSDITLSEATVAESAVGGTVLGTLVGVDADADDVLTYALVDDAGGRFVVDAATGLVTVAADATLDHEVQQNVAITVRVTDAGGLAVERNFTIVIGNVVEQQIRNGTSAADMFVVASADDWTISGLAGNDVIVTLGGIDTIRGGTGDDSIATGGGDDTVLVTGATDGFDAVDGGEGEDRIIATAANTFIGLRSISGVETISSGEFAGVSILGSAMDDVLDFTGVIFVGLSKIDGGAGNDMLVGTAGDDLIVGGAGDDRLDGSAGDDRFGILVGAGSDHFLGGAGIDRILASADNAVIGIASLSGIEAISSNGRTGITIAGTAGDDVLDFSAITLSGIGRINAGTGNDIITGSAGADVIAGQGGDDILFGAGGNDVFEISTGGGIDTIDGGAGFDTIRFIAASATLTWTGVTDVEAVTANGLTGTTIAGGAGDDLLDFSTVTLTGIARLDGGAGADTIIGSAGNDRLFGNSGADRLTGGAGADVFDFDRVPESAPSAADRITDFTQGSDKIDLSTIDASSRNSGEQAFSFIGSAAFSGAAGQLRYERVGEETHIFGDTNGDRIADFELLLTGLYSLNSGDFAL